MAVLPKKPAPPDFKMSFQRAKESSWYSDRLDPRCPHDAWLSGLDFTIEGREQDEQNCRKTLKIVLLGAYHNGSITLTYRNVRTYQIILNRQEERVGMIWGRQDWLDDRVTLLRPDLIEHKIEWEDEDWLIEATEVDFEWAKFDE